MKISTLLTEIEYLPQPVQRQIMDYIGYLINKYRDDTKKEKKETFKFNWEGGLKNKFPNTTSVELQHLANKLR